MDGLDGLMLRKVWAVLQGWVRTLRGERRFLRFPVASQEYRAVRPGV